MKESSTTEIFNANEALLRSLISNQVLEIQKPLLNALDFWLKSKHHWPLYFRHSVHHILRSSLADAVKASMKADSGKNLSLVDLIINFTVDSLHNEANICNRQAGERMQGRGPTGVELGERKKMRQVRRAMNFTESCEVNLSGISDSENISSIFDETQSHRPDKLVKKRSSGNLPPVRSKSKRSIQCSSFLKILDFFHQHESKMNVISYVKEEASYKVTLNDDGVIRNVEISREFFCSCKKTIHADRKACLHIIWCLNKIRLIGLDDDIIGHIYLEGHENKSLKIPNILRE